MPTMSDVLTKHEVSAADSDWLHRLVGDWQLLSDLSFADLVLWVPDHDPNVYWAAAQVRPQSVSSQRAARAIRRSPGGSTSIS